MTDLTLINHFYMQIPKICKGKSTRNISDFFFLSLTKSRQIRKYQTTNFDLPDSKLDKDNFCNKITIILILPMWNAKQTEIM